MMIKQLSYISACLFMLLALPASHLSAAQAITTSDPGIAADELELKLRPLRRDEVKIEVEAWLVLLADHIREVSEAEIAVKYKLLEISVAKALEDALDSTEQAKDAAAELPEDEAAQKALTTAEENYNQLLQDAKNTVKNDKGKQYIDAVTRRAEARVEELGIEKPEDEALEDEQPGEQATEEDAVSGTQAKLDEGIRERDRQRDVLLEYLTDLRTQQVALIERTSTVVDVFEDKGGVAEEVEEYRKYISAVSGVQVDVSDLEATWRTISGWVLSEEGGLRLLKKFAVFVIIILISFFLARLVSRAIKSVIARTAQTSKLLGDFLVVTARRLVLAVGVLIGLAALGINVGPLLALIGAAGFVVAFALQNSLGNFASGILIMVFKPFDLGDLVEIDGILGVVKSMNLLSVQLRTMDNRAVIIPNNNVWGGAITNVNGTDTRRVDLVFGIAYDDDIEKAQKIMEQVIAGHPLVLEDPAPVVRVHELGDSSVNFICRPWVKTRDYWEVYWDITRGVKEQFDKEGISIPFPQRDLHIYNAVPAGIPAVRQPADKAPDDVTGGWRAGGSDDTD